MRKLNIGLIGAGGIGRIHFYNALKLKKARLVAIADSSKKSQSFARAHNIPKIYSDFEKLLADPSVDCVVISLPTFLHSKCALLAAEQGKHFFIEKPLARNPKEGKTIVSKAQKAGVKTMIGYPLRFSDFATIKKDIISGSLGDIVTANAINVGKGPFFARVSAGSIPSPVPSWWFKPELVGGGVLLDLGSHMINLLLWFFGNEIISVRSVLGHRFNMRYEDYALCFIKFRRGTLATVNVGWFSMQQTVKVELFGTVRLSFLKERSEKIPFKLLRLLGITPMTHTSAFFNELNYFVECILSDCDPSPSLTEGLKDLEVIASAYQNELECP
ncbi:MAG: Gfo/Idh/MocA family oxidoreductase [Candidatus Bathyarchaeota archaeon]|nr:MAG: Gfo/Idh/MocA family oxidoreductase [Candidatus Bathyarchaeota archaeon]